MAVCAILHSNLVQEPYDAALLLLRPAEKRDIVVCTGSAQNNESAICSNGLRGKLRGKGFWGPLQQSQFAQSLVDAAAFSADAEYQKRFV